MLTLKRIGQLLGWLLLAQALIASPALQASNLPVLTQPVAAEPFHIQIRRTGRIDFRYITNLSFKTSGYVEKLHADAGQRVLAGDTLATLELTDLLAAQASAAAAKGKAVQDAARARKLYKEKKTVSKDFLEQAETNLVRAKSTQKQADYNLQKARIEAPFEAVIINRLTQPGEQVLAGSPIYSVASLASDNLVVRLNLTQQEITLLHFYDQISIVLANQHQVEGHMLSVSATADAVTGLYEVEIALDLQDQSVLPGQWVKTRISVTGEQLSYPIPVLALAGIINGQARFVIQEKTSYKLIARDILHMDQQFIYVPASEGTLDVVTHGWDRLLNLMNQ